MGGARCLECVAADADERDDDGAEQRERTGEAAEETPLREREENFLSLDRVR